MRGLISIAIGIAYIGIPQAAAQNQEPLKQTFEKLLPGMSAKDIGARRGPQQQWQKVCFEAGAPGNEKMRLQVCRLMLRKISPKTPLPTRFWLLKQLEYVGRDESVNGVASLLNDQNDRIRFVAIRCLTNNPSPKATGKLLSVIPKSDAKTKVALLNALGYRADASAVPSLAKELAAAESSVVEAAARALGKIATPEVAKQLAIARKGAKSPSRLWICDAYLACADRLLKNGKTKDAAPIYKHLYETEKTRSTRLAALQGMIKAAGDQAGVLIYDILAGKDSDGQNVALTNVQTISASALNAMTARIGKLPKKQQVRLLRVLAARGDKSQKTIALAAAKSNDEALQQAGLHALGRLGDVTVVAMLVDTMFTKSKVAGAARGSLENLVGDGVNEKIIALLKSQKDVKRRLTMINVIEARRIAAALPVLLDESVSKEAVLRRSALSALRYVAEPKDIPKLIPALLVAENRSEQEHAERTILEVCKRIPEVEKRPDAIHAAVTPKSKAVLLPLLGSMGGAKTYKLAKEAMASDDAKLAEAGLIALCNWPNAEVSNDLLFAAKNATKPQHRSLALNNVVRVNSLKKTPDAAKTRLGVMQEAMKLAKRKQQKQRVLTGLATVQHIGTLRYVLPYLKDKELNQSACRTIVELAHSQNLRRPNQKEFVRALDQVIAICRDAGLVDRAKKYKGDG